MSLLMPTLISTTCSFGPDEVYGVQDGNHRTTGYGGKVAYEREQAHLPIPDGCTYQWEAAQYHARVMYPMPYEIMFILSQHQNKAASQTGVTTITRLMSLVYQLRFV